MTILDYDRQISKLESIAENAVVEAEFYSIQESAAYDWYSLNEASSKKNGFMNKVKSALSKAWHKFLELIRKVKRHIVELFGKGTYAQEDIQDVCNAVYTGKLNSKLKSYCNTLFKKVQDQQASQRIEKQVDIKNDKGEVTGQETKVSYKVDKKEKELTEIKSKLYKFLDEEGKSNRTIKVNQSTKHVYTLIEECEGLVTTISHWVDERSQAGDLSGFCTDMLARIREYLQKVITQCERVARASSMGSSVSKRYNNSVETRLDIARRSGYTKADNARNISELNDFKNRMDLRNEKTSHESAMAVTAAQCLIEAARLLNEEGEVDDLSDAYSLPLSSETDGPSYDDIDDINLSQDDIELDDEYPTDTSGGEGQELSGEEIHDLCDGDKEAIALLTDDDGSETIDAGKAISESYFNFNF
jgi:hypothetical protein